MSPLHPAQSGADSRKQPAWSNNAERHATTLHTANNDNHIACRGAAQTAAARNRRARPVGRREPKARVNVRARSDRPVKQTLAGGRAAPTVTDMPLLSPAHPTLRLPGTDRDGNKRVLRRPDLRHLVTPRLSAEPFGDEISWQLCVSVSQVWSTTAAISAPMLVMISTATAYRF